MQAVAIRDLVAGGGYLAVDLRHVLDALGERALNSSWRIEDVWATDDSERKLLQTLADKGHPVSGRDLKEAAEAVEQVIDGEFSAFEPGHVEPWVIIEAVDSTYYTVRSQEPNVLQSIRHSFREVSEYEHPDA
jgi:hypothetical protein